MSGLKFSSLRIKRNDYGKNVGKTTGAIEYAGDFGKIELILDDEHVSEIFKVVADSLVRVSREAARSLTAEALEQTRED